MPWYYFIYDGYGNAYIAGCLNNEQETQEEAAALLNEGELVSDIFRAEDGYENIFTRRRVIMTVDLEGNTLEMDI